MCDVASALEACTVASAAHSPAPSASSAALPPIQTTLQCTGLTVVPDHNGVRFCRVCNAFLPLSMFPAGHRRYTCRPHLWQRVGKKARQTAYNAVPRRRLLASIWTRCWKDAKNSNCLGMALAVHSPPPSICALRRAPAELSERSRFPSVLAFRALLGHCEAYIPGHSLHSHTVTGPSE